MDEPPNSSHCTNQQLTLSASVQEDLRKYGLTDKDQTLPLKNPSGAKLRKADVVDTIYRDDEDKMYAWGKFFLPDPVHMQVFAVVEDVSCDDLVLMTCEDKQVYAYEDECLHLVAKDLEELFEEGLRWPAYEKYYEGDAFKHMTEEDWAKEMQSPLGKKLDEEHRKLVESFEPRILEILRNTRSKQELASETTDSEYCSVSESSSSFNNRLLRLREVDKEEKQRHSFIPAN